MADRSLQWDRNRFDNIANHLFGLLRSMPPHALRNVEGHTVRENNRNKFLNIVGDAIVTLSAKC